MLVKRRIRMSIGVAIAAVAVLTVSLFSSQAFAQSSTTSTANVLRVSPIRSDISIEPGKSKTVETVVTNLTDSAIRVHPSANDFVASDERGTPGLILDETQFAPTHSLKRFMEPLHDVTIPAGESKTIKVIITVPNDAQAGGYFGAVRFSPSSPDGGGQVNLSASVASLILMTVPGEMVEKLDLSDFAILQNGKTSTLFTNGNGLQLTVRFENKGNVQVGPLGKVTVKNGDTIVYEADFNTDLPRDVVLPESARRWDIPLDSDKLDAFGNYTVLATFTYGQKNQTIEVTKSFWVIPWMFIIIALVGLVVLAGLIVLIVFLNRRRKRSRSIARSAGYRR